MRRIRFAIGAGLIVLLTGCSQAQPLKLWDFMSSGGHVGFPVHI